MSSTEVATSEKADGAACRDQPRDTAANLSWLYDRYRQDVFHLALRYGRGNTAWAEDVTQDVFVQLLRAPKVLAAEESLSGWFYRVTTNRCFNKLRHEALRRSLPVRWLLGAPHESARTPETDAMARDELSHAFEAVSALPTKERLAFFMHHVDGKDQIEIAQILGHSKGYISKLLKRAHERLTRAGWKVDHASS